MKSIQTSDAIGSLYLKIPKVVKRAVIPIINYFRIKQQYKLQTPKVLLLYITNNCNSRCRHCFYWKELNKGENLLTIENLTKLAKSLKHPLDLLVLTGGEPSMRNDLFEVCKAFVENNKTKRIHFITNGYLTDKIIEQTKQLLTLKIKITAQVSIDGLEETHDDIRAVKDSFANAVKTIKELAKLNCPLAANTTITKRNIGELRQLSEHIQALDVTQKYNIARTDADVFNIDKSILAEFSMQNKENLHPEPEEMGFVKELLSNRDKTISSRIEIKKMEYMLQVLQGKKPIKCLAGIRQGVVYPNGDVSICEPSKPFANLKDFDFDFFKLWNSEKASNMRSKLKNCSCIQSCNILDSMAYDNKTLIEL